MKPTKLKEETTKDLDLCKIEIVFSTNPGHVMTFLLMYFTMIASILFTK